MVADNKSCKNVVTDSTVKKVKGDTLFKKKVPGNKIMCNADL